ncbi:MAG: N-6 DNA methylase [Gammaproteobacteria bacterium]|nr:N-6 DNA methylase [Gammaproteobacteria bacterium]MYH13842.1 N-6 DNA methylase [Gammaproteobacteria bacterium]
MASPNMRPATKPDTAEAALRDPHLIEAIARNVVGIEGQSVTYHIGSSKTYDWGNPEEWVRARTIAFLVVARDYPAKRVGTEVTVPSRTGGDRADVVVFRDDEHRDPYLVVECKPVGSTDAVERQAIEQAFGYGGSFRSAYVLYDQYDTSRLFDLAGFPSGERVLNVLGSRDAAPHCYGEAPAFALVAGGETDIAPVVDRSRVGMIIRQAHSAIWSGGKRDPLTAFDEWSKLLFAKIADERHTPNGQPRRFQVGVREKPEAVAARIRQLFAEAVRRDPAVFPPGAEIGLPPDKIVDVVRTLDQVSFSNTDVDVIGAAFEGFFGAIFRGELGQYFTMRPLARFIVALLNIHEGHYVLDPTAGSGGFLLETLLQVWGRIDAAYQGQAQLVRTKSDFAANRLFGIEIHATLARICKINLLLHQDGHTNVEGDRSCLDTEFANARLSLALASAENPARGGGFDCIVGNPPFGDSVAAGDPDLLGANVLEAFEIARDRQKVPSEHVILERSIQLLAPGGRLGFILPDGLLNNQGEGSNCPQARALLAENGFVEAVISLPDHAFHTSGAQNKTSVLVFRKFVEAEANQFKEVRNEALAEGRDRTQAIADAWTILQHRTFLAEADHVGYLPTGAATEQNDLYLPAANGMLANDQAGSILGEYRRFLASGAEYEGVTNPHCATLPFEDLWSAHESNRLDPKYFLFKLGEESGVPDGWNSDRLGDLMRRRDSRVRPEETPDQEFVVMTLGQNGEIRPREAGKGRNPPQWLGMYFDGSPSRWHSARSGDLVYSSIDLWKGCIAVVTEPFDGALVTSEFPIYQVTDGRLDPRFLAYLLRTPHYQRAFRAITTGHSNRRRAQTGDFEAIRIAFPSREEQQRLVERLEEARTAQRQAGSRFAAEFERLGQQAYQVVADSVNLRGH